MESEDELTVETTELYVPSRQVRRAAARQRRQVAVDLIAYRTRRRERRRIAAKSRARNRR